MGKLNWKKILLFSLTAGLVPSLQNWAQTQVTGTPIPFTLGTVLLPALPGIFTTLAALFSNPRHSQ